MNFAWDAYGMMLAVLCALGFGFWVLSLLRRDVSIVDSLWSLMFLVIAAGYGWQTGAGDMRSMIVLALATLWALRLSIFISVRNHGEPEDYRYQKIRANNEPGFWWKSLYIVFGLQVLLAWLVAMPLAASMNGPSALGLMDFLGLSLWVIGMIFECFGDAQLARFKRDPSNRGKVLNTGLWRFTRHPNYFGEFTLWWGFYLIAVAGGGAWTILSPLLMSFLLLRVSGVAMLEKDIGERRPEYANYIRATNAFFPGPPRSVDS